MKPVFVPDDFEVPREFEGKGYRLEPLGAVSVYCRVGRGVKKLYSPVKRNKRKGGQDVSP